MVYRHMLPLLIFVLVGCETGQAGGAGGTGGSAGAGGATPSPEAIEVVEVPLPEGVSIPSQQNSTGFTVDGSRLFTTVIIDGVEGRHIATLAKDGSDFRCLTCEDLASPDVDLRQPQMATDGRRFAVRNGSGEQRHAFIECTPSILDCQTAAFVPLEVPLGPVALLRTDQLRISPDGEHVLFVHVRQDGLLIPVFGGLVRETDPDTYSVDDPRALAGFRPTFTGPSDALELAEGNWGEGKGFSDGGASVVYYTTIDSLNYDSVKLDLETGEITRLTSDPEYDEDVHISPDGQWVVTASFRNYQRMSVFSLVPRPPIIDAALRGPIALLRNENERRFFDLWLLPFGRADEDAEIAQQILDDDEVNELSFNTRGQGRWSGDGTQFVFVEEDARALGTARLKHATFTSRQPATPVPIVASPEPTWAPPVSDVLSPTEITLGTLQGPASGRAEVDFELQLAPLSGMVDMEVTYVDYSADGCSFLNGTEAVTVDVVAYTWTADLEVTGCHVGSLVADVEGIAFPASATGTIVAEYDGDRREGLPPR